MKRTLFVPLALLVASGVIWLSGCSLWPWGGASGGPPRQAMEHFFMARYCLSRGWTDQATDHYRQALRHDSDSAMLNHQLATLLVRQGRVVEALPAAQRAVDLDKKNIKARLLLAGIYSSRHDYDRSIEQYREVVRLDPDNAEAHLYLGTLYAQKKDYRASLKVLKRVVRLKPRSAMARYYLGRIHLELKQYRAAEYQFKRALKLNPFFEAALFDLGYLYETQGRNDEAETVYKRILFHRPKNARAHDRLGRLYLRTGRYRKALGQFKIIKGLQPPTKGLRIRMGLIYFEQRNYAKAAQEFNLVLSNDPKDDRVRYFLATTLMQKGDYATARKQFLRIPPQSKVYVSSRLHLVYVLEKMKRRAEAFKVMRTALRLRPDSVKLYLGLAGLYELAKDYNRARGVLLQGLGVKPKNPGLLFQLGVVMDKMGRKDLALKRMRQVLSVKSDHADS
ncbi:MAG: tetratricopeptide repeat protein, partial [Proteobacteria bacterium]|nr:tetratricopeptide repeat protein [Pseudomonadota bacterium]